MIDPCANHEIVSVERITRLTAAFIGANHQASEGRPMDMLTRDAFETWLQAYRAAWEGRDAQAAVSLCSLR